MEFLTFAWPTSTTNKPDASAEAAVVLKRRARELSADALQRCAYAWGYVDLDALGRDRRGFLPRSTRRASDTDAAAGRKCVESCLDSVVTTLTTLYDDPVHQLDLMLVFDGRRWWATKTEARQYPNAPHRAPFTDDRLGLFRMFSASGIADDPTDGAEFVDVQAVTAAVCVLDDLAADTRKALDGVGLSVEQRRAVDAALGAARLDVTRGARTIRTAFSAVSANS